MGRKGFIYDMSRCIGCKTCQMACKEKNSLPVGAFFRRVETIEVNCGAKKYVHYSGACNHCEDPACMAVCPTGAMHRDAEGLVVHDDARCIGCGRCVNACPYGAASLNKVTGYAQKCDACAAMRKEGREPACVTACPTRALRFGDIEETESAENCTKANLVFLPDTKETHPTTRILNAAEELTDSTQTENYISKAENAVAFRKNTNERFVILGAGPAAVSAAEAIRERNETASITMLSHEKFYPYCRPLMSKGRYHGFRHSDYAMFDDEWLEEKNITLHVNTEITGLDLKEKTVTVNDGEKIPYDKCVYALGADGMIPPFPGTNKKGVYPIRTIPHIEALRREKIRAEKVIIVGGGVIGLETAWQMKEAGLDVTIVEFAPTIMGRLVDDTTAELLKSVFEAHGIKVQTSAGLKAVLGGERCEAVELTNGMTLPADIVVLSAGIRINAAIAEKAGLKTERAIVVDDHMKSSDDNVYACGDCAIFEHVNNATWIQGVAHGTVAGANAAGDDITYIEKPSSIVVHAAETQLYTIGDLGKNGCGEYELISCTVENSGETFSVNTTEMTGKDTHASFCFQGGKLVGAATIGELKCLRYVQDCVNEHTDKDSFLAGISLRGARL